MPVRMLNFLTAPPPPKSFRGPDSPMFHTEEWQDLVMALGSGLKPQEYVTVSFPKEHAIYKAMKHPNESMLRAVKQKVKDLKLPYDVYLRNNTVYIVGRGTLS